MFEVTFRARHDCPYVAFSMKHPDVRVVEWCNGRTDVLEVETADAETFDRIQSDLQNLILWRKGRVLGRGFSERNLQIIMKTCPGGKISPSITGVIERNSCLEMPPVVYRDGWEEHKAMGFTDKDYKKLFRDLAKLGPVEVLEKKLVPGTKLRDTFAISISGIFSKLTKKQIDALVAALDYGYYQTPRRMTAKEIAGKLKVPRTTYEEHVRKAERKVLRAMAPYVKLYGTYAPRTLEVHPQLVAR